MKLIVATSVAISLANACIVLAAMPVELEIATDRGVQITAPQEWLQLLTSIGVTRVQIRGMRTGDKPQVLNSGSAARPDYHVVGILSARGQLKLPGGTFTRGDRARLKDYFEGLAADGVDAIAGARGEFGLTEKEFEELFARLAQPVDFPTRGQLPKAAIDEFGSTFGLKIAYDDSAMRAISSGPPLPVADDVRGLSAGTGLAIVLHNQGLAMYPEKQRGQPVVCRISALDGEGLTGRHLGKRNAVAEKSWPIGWEAEKAPGELAPALSDTLNAEISGYTMAEAIDAIRPRAKLPIYFNRAALSLRQVDPARLQVRLPRARVSYKVLVDRIVAKAGMGSELRVDEAGRPFLWITR
jgi:hypothetical protein